MARINFERAVKEGQKIINPRYDMSYDQLMKLKEAPDIIESISNAFSYGYLQGTKAVKAEMRKGGATHAQ